MEQKKKKKGDSSLFFQPSCSQMQWEKWIKSDLGFPSSNSKFSANPLLLSLIALMTDDLTDAIICAKKIVKETDGMNYW